MPVIKLTTKMFENNIFEFRTELKWKYKGTLPVIIEFYADWARPNPVLATLGINTTDHYLEEISDEFKDRVVVYKCDIEVEKDLSLAFGLKSIPTTIFIPMDKLPIVYDAPLEKKTVIEMINKFLI